MISPSSEPITPLPEALNEEPSDRRGWVRHPIALKGQCHAVTALDPNHRWPIQTWDVSAGGVAVVVCRRFEPGTLLALSLSAAGQDMVSMPLVRVRRVSETGKHWLLGCAWVDELEKADLGLLLNP
jgi:hypothetical protein